MIVRHWVIAIVGILTWIASAPPAVPDQQTFRADVKAVPIYVSVIDDHGHLVTDLTRDDFQVYDDGRSIALAVFDDHAQPITGALLLQVGGFLSSQFQREREAAAAFVNALAPEDRIRIGSLGREVAISPLLTGDKQTLLRIIGEELWPGIGGTPLWRAVAGAMDALSPEPGRRAIVVVTDNRENFPAPPPEVVDHLLDAANDQSRREKRTVEERLRAGAHVLYTVSLDGTLGMGTYLDETVDATGGGRIKLRAPDDTGATMERVVEELRHQYTLGFIPATLDGGVHRLQVKVNRKGVKARFRQSYVATP